MKGLILFARGPMPILVTTVVIVMTCMYNKQAAIGELVLLVVTRVLYTTLYMPLFPIEWNELLNEVCNLSLLYRYYFIIVETGYGTCFTVLLILSTLESTTGTW
jgi:hypothetical protein